MSNVVVSNNRLTCSNLVTGNLVCLIRGNCEVYEITVRASPNATLILYLITSSCTVLELNLKVCSLLNHLASTLLVGVSSLHKTVGLSLVLLVASVLLE